MADVAAQILAFATLVVFAVYAAIVDAKTQTIPDLANLGLFTTGLLVSVVVGFVTPASALAAAVLSGLLLWSVRAGFRALRGYDGLGFGDVKFVAAASTWTGVENVAVALLIACAVALSYVLLRQVFDASFDSTRRVPFCPFLAIGVVCVVGLRMWFGPPFDDVFGTVARAIGSG